MTSSVHASKRLGMKSPLGPPVGALEYKSVQAYVQMHRSNPNSIHTTVSELLAAIPRADVAVRSVTGLFIDRAAEAAHALSKRPDNGALLPLYGVPVLVKENISVQGAPLRCGSKILEGYHCPYSATVIDRLERAGAIVLGYTNMDEFAMGSSCEHSCHGPTFNPYDHALVPGGSSGGGAAASALGFAPLSFGSDTGGSVRQPASFCHVYGFKPTYGLLSRYGLVAFGSSLDQISPFARRVEDLIDVLHVVAGLDPLDATSVSISESEKTQILKSALKIGFPQALVESFCDAAVKSAFELFINQLKDFGCETENVELPDLGVALPVYYVLSSAEASSNLSRFDGLKFGARMNHSDREESVRLARSLGFGKEVKRRICLGTFVLSSGYYEAYYGKAMLVRKLLCDGFDQVFEKHDFLVMPTTPSTAFKIGANISDPVQMYANDVLTIPPSLVGLPALSVPVGTLDGRPLGIQIIGKKGSDFVLLQLALALEEAGICGISGIVQH